MQIITLLQSILAQTAEAVAAAPTPAPSDGSPVIKLLPYVLTGGLALAAFFGLGALVRGKLGVLFDWLAQVTHVQKLAQLDEAIVGFALDLKPLADEFRKRAADGTISKEDREALQRMLLAKLKEHFGMDFLGTLTKGVLDDFLMSRIEAGVLESKTRATEAKPSAAGAAPRPSMP